MWNSVSASIWFAYHVIVWARRSLLRHGLALRLRGLRCGPEMGAARVFQAIQTGVRGSIMPPRPSVPVRFLNNVES
jgi:hypothetical protein